MSDEQMTADDVAWVRAQRITEVDDELCLRENAAAEGRCAYAGPDGEDACGVQCRLRHPKTPTEDREAPEAESKPAPALTEWEWRHALRHCFPARVRCADCGQLVRDVLRVFPEAGHESDGGTYRFVCLECAGPAPSGPLSAPGAAYAPGGCCEDIDELDEA